MLDWVNLKLGLLISVMFQWVEPGWFISLKITDTIFDPKIKSRKTYIKVERV